MRRSLILVATLAILPMLQGQAHAQRGGRGTVNTPYGQFSMSEMKAAGGNPIVAGQLREQRLMTQYQQQMMKQQQRNMQQLAKQQKALAKKPAATNSTPASKTAKNQTKTATPKTATSGATKNATAGTPKNSTPTTPHVPGAPTN
jgi:uncharacterized protein with WD repeat